LIDCGRFADTGNPSNPEPNGVACAIHKLLQDLLRQFLVLRSGALDQRDRARQHGPVAADYPLFEVFWVKQGRARRACLRWRSFAWCVRHL
jgi:hypothetical protein